CRLSFVPRHPLRRPPSSLRDALPISFFHDPIYWLSIFCNILVFVIPYFVYKINNRLHEYGDPSWKREDNKNLKSNSTAFSSFQFNTSPAKKQSIADPSTVQYFAFSIQSKFYLIFASPKA